MNTTRNDLLLLNFLLEEKRPGEVALNRLLPRALRALRQHLGMDVAFISEFQNDAAICRYVDCVPEELRVVEGTAISLAQTLSHRAITGDIPPVIADVMSLRGLADIDTCTSLPVRAHACVPIYLNDGRVFGALTCTSRLPNLSLNDRDLSLIRVFAEMAGEHFEADISAARIEHATVASVKAVLGGDEMSVAYQPVFDLLHGGLVGFESLARFTTLPQRSPIEWFRDAARVGLDVALEKKVITRILEGFDTFPSGVYVALNVTPNMLMNGDFSQALTGIPLRRVVLEVNEHVSIREYEAIARVLQPLREQKLRISVDDDGTGIGSFRHILSLRPDIVKLRRGLTGGIDRDEASRALASALIKFARDSGSEVIAEGVETHEELRTLRELGVTKAQGYLLGRPAPLSTAAQLCRHLAAA